MVLDILPSKMCDYLMGGEMIRWVILCVAAKTISIGATPGVNVIYKYQIIMTILLSNISLSW